MTSASQRTHEGAQDIGRSFAQVRKEVKKLHEQTRRTNRAMAQFEETLANMGIKLTHRNEENTSV